VEFSIIHDAKDLIKPVETGIRCISARRFHGVVGWRCCQYKSGESGTFNPQFSGEDTARLPGDVNVEEKTSRLLPLAQKSKLKEVEFWRIWNVL
jgi:hypothetical protein